MKEEMWTPIPFFEGYEISNMKRIRSLHFTQPLIKKEQSWGTVHLRREKKEYTISINHLLYGTQQNIDPLLLKNCVMIEDPDTKVLKVYTKDEYNQLRLKKMHRVVAIKPEEVEPYYRNAIRFSESVLLAYKTGEWSNVINEFVSYKQYALDYMRKGRFTLNRDTAEEAWSHIMAECIIRIKNKSGKVIVVEGYIKRIIRQYFGLMKAEKKKLISYDDINYFGEIR